MTTPTKPSAGALRAAKAIDNEPGAMPYEPIPVEEIAAIIDRESGTKELADSIREAFTDKIAFPEDHTPHDSEEAFARVRRHLEEALRRYEEGK